MLNGVGIEMGPDLQFIYFFLFLFFFTDSDSPHFVMEVHTTVNRQNRQLSLN